jgi:hypothetical protein
MENHMGSKPTIDDAIVALQQVAEIVLELGIDEVAKEADLKPRQVRKFVNDVLTSKNSEIRLISAAVASMREELKN